MARRAKPQPDHVEIALQQQEGAAQAFIDARDALLDTNGMLTNGITSDMTEIKRLQDRVQRAEDLRKANAVSIDAMNRLIPAGQ